MVKKGNDSYRNIKVKVEYFFEQYRNIENKIATMNYDSRYCIVDEQMARDAQNLAQTQKILATCSKETREFILYNYIHPENDKLYFKGLSRSSVYRLNKKAILEIADCLHL